MMIQQIAKVYNPRNEPPWWNRPLWGQGNLFANLSKPEVPHKAILLHNQQLQQAKEIAEKAKALDSQEFIHKGVRRLLILLLTIAIDAVVGSAAPYEKTINYPLSTIHYQLSTAIINYLL